MAQYVVVVLSNLGIRCLARMFELHIHITNEHHKMLKTNEFGSCARVCVRARASRTHNFCLNKLLAIYLENENLINHFQL